MLVTVHSGKLRGTSTVGVLEGTDAEGRRVTFAVDHRPCRNIIEDLHAGEVPEVEVEPWMVLAIRAPQTREGASVRLHGIKPDPPTTNEED